MPRPAAVLALAATIAAPGAFAEPFTVIALGDMPYGEPQDVYPPFETLIETVNGRAPELVIHVGDTKAGGTECSDQMLDDQLGYLGDFSAPVIYTPGDNEWTDCHREAAGGFDPLDRLRYIRDTYFSEPDRSFGQEAVALTSQAGAGYPENVRLELNGVSFVTAHVVGSNNNFEIRDMDAVDEFMARDAANIDWLAESFADAAEAEALVLAIHADMFQDFSGFAEEGWYRHSGFQAFGEALIEQAAAFGRPVLVVYGDSHVFTQLRPLPTEAPNVMALEVPGAEDMHALEITIDPETSGVFSVALVRNPALSN